MWLDPDEGASGVLLSDRIQFYVDRVGLITPFEKESLGPASYDLRLGTLSWDSSHSKESGLPLRTLKPGEVLIIPPNSITFVSTLEALNLPFYLTGRFNLRLRLLHEGLLVGTGPQIDPGFSGQLSCPLHNISNDKIALVCGARFAVIEFSKTTPFAQSSQWFAKDTIDSVREDGEAEKLFGLDRKPCLTFPRRALNRKPIEKYLPHGKTVSSSVDGLAAEIKRQELKRSEHESTVKEKIKEHTDSVEKRLGFLTWTTFITLVVVVLSVASLVLSAIGWKNSQLVEMRTRIQLLEAKIAELSTTGTPAKAAAGSSSEDSKGGQSTNVPSRPEPPSTSIQIMPQNSTSPSTNGAVSTP